MKKLLFLLLFPGWLFATSITFYVNGVASNTMVQGDQVRWFLTTNNPGGTLTIHIYRDVDGNQQFNPTDQILDFFTITDNDPNPDGPGDTDGLTNGELDVPLGNLGFTVGDYIFLVMDEDGTIVTAPFHVDPMNPADVQQMIIGQISLSDVSTPNPVYAGFIFGLFTDSGIYMGQTDSTGHFTIPINNPVTGGNFDEMFDFSRPAKYSTNFQGMNLSINSDTVDVGTISYIAGNFRIYGNVMNEMEAALGRYLYINVSNDNGSLDNEWYVSPDGSYEIYLSITQPETLHLNLPEDDLMNMGYMSPDAWAQSSPYRLVVDATSSEQFVPVVVYSINDSIFVQLTGGETDSSYRFAASNSSIYAVSFGYTDPTNGLAIIPVNHSVKNYWVYLSEWETPPPAGKVLNPQGGQSANVGDTISFAFVDPTGIQDDNSSVQKFQLNQNYPNPFNPSTTISFYLQKAGPVSLTVYNIFGQKIATILQNNLLKEGSHNVVFHAADLPSGVYLYKLTAGNFTATKKMILLK